MFEWKVEDMALMDPKNSVVISGRKVYHCELETCRDDKLAFVDSMTDGRLSYLLLLIEQFNKDKEDLPKDRFGKVKTVSLKAWIKRNDTKYGKPIIDGWFHYGMYDILGCSRHITNCIKGDHDFYDDLVAEAFHRQLVECERSEKQYFADHDEYSILKKRLCEKAYRTTFGVQLGQWSSGRVTVCDDDGNERDITIDELKELMDKYDQLDALIEKLTSETHITY